MNIERNITRSVNRQLHAHSYDYLYYFFYINNNKKKNKLLTNNNNNNNNNTNYRIGLLNENTHDSLQL